MEYARLYEIENDILSIYESMPKSEKSKNDDKIINSIIFHYTQSYLLKNTIVTSELLEKENGDTFVGLLTYSQLEQHSPKIKPDEFLSNNLDYIDNKAKEYEGGFEQYCKDNYDKNFFNLGKSDDYKVYLKSLLNDYPLAKHSISSLTQFSDWKRTYDKDDGKKTFDFNDDDKFRKIKALDMSEIKKTDLGNKIMSVLISKEKYDLIFEDNINYQKLNLSERKNYEIIKIDLGEDPAKKLNEINDIQLKNYDQDYYSIYEKLYDDGHKYLKNIVNRATVKNEALISVNRFGIGGILIYGEQLTENSAHLNDKANWISSMSTGREFRGNKIALKLFEFAANKAVDNEQILFITTSSPEGKKYLEKQIDKSITKNKYYNIIRADEMERYLGQELFSLLYATKKEINLSQKIYSIKKVENPYKEFISIMKFFHENAPSLDNIDDASQYYEINEKREKFVNELIKNVESALKGDEIKNSKKNSFKPK